MGILFTYLIRFLSKFNWSQVLLSLTRILTERFNWSKSNILCERTKKKLEVIMDVVVVDKVVEEVNKVVAEVNKKLVKEYNDFFNFTSVWEKISWRWSWMLWWPGW